MSRFDVGWKLRKDLDKEEAAWRHVSVIHLLNLSTAPRACARALRCCAHLIDELNDSSLQSHSSLTRSSHMCRASTPDPG